MVHEIQVIHSLSVHPSWQRIKAQFIGASLEEVDASIQTVMAPMKQCIHAHYERLVDNIHQEMTNCPIRTYQTMYEHNPDNYWLTIEACITQLFHQLKQQPTSNTTVEANNNTVNNTTADDHDQRNRSPTQPTTTDNNNVSQVITSTPTCTNDDNTRANNTTPGHNRKSYKDKNKAKPLTR